MDETGVEILFAALGVIIALAIISLWWWQKQERMVEAAREWPAAEATVQSGGLEPVREGKAILPVFAFSYQVGGKYYSGRLGLARSDRDPESLIQRMIGRKLQIRYDPSHPEVWFVADDEIEGCKVEQKIGPHFVALYPRD
jgi:hypothetical protein